MTTALHLPLLGAEHKRAPFEYADRVEPGFTRAELYRLFAEKGFTRGAEIGVADGRNALTMCQAIPGLTLYCVDPWAKYPGNPRGGPQDQHDRNFVLAHSRLDTYDVVWLRGTSEEVIRESKIPSLDYVYIDGNHQREFVAFDLEHWPQRVRSGGIVAGHDFYNFGSAGVVEAVVEYTQRHGITDWALCDEREPSFWWVKP